PGAGSSKAVVRRGVHKVSMSDFGDYAGVSRGTLYRYFASKNDVMRALPDFVQARWGGSACGGGRPARAGGAAVRAPRRHHPRRRDLAGHGAPHPAGPAFGLRMLERALPRALRVLTDLLEPV